MTDNELDLTAASDAAESGSDAVEPASDKKTKTTRKPRTSTSKVERTPRKKTTRTTRTRTTKTALTDLAEADTTNSDTVLQEQASAEPAQENAAEALQGEEGQARPAAKKPARRTRKAPAKPRLPRGSKKTVAKKEEQPAEMDLQEEERPERLPLQEALLPAGKDALGSDVLNVQNVSSEQNVQDAQETASPSDPVSAALPESVLSGDDAAGKASAETEPPLSAEQQDNALDQEDAAVVAAEAEAQEMADVTEVAEAARTAAPAGDVSETPAVPAVAETAAPAEDTVSPALQPATQPSVRDWSSWTGWDEPAEEPETAAATEATVQTEQDALQPAQALDAPLSADSGQDESGEGENQDAGRQTLSGQFVETEPAPMEEEPEWLRDVQETQPLSSNEAESIAAMPMENGWNEEGAEDDDTAEDSALSKRRRRGRRGGRSHKKPVAETFSQDTAPVTMSMAGSSSSPVTTVHDEKDLHGENSAALAFRHGKRRMYISVLPGEQVEVAITNNGILDEYYLDMLHQKKIKGNIYRGVIVNIDINLQAAFVDFGTEKNGFLQIDEIHPEYFTTPQEYVRGKKYPPIQKVLRLGQEVLVQVVKEPNGSKGAFLTTWISLAGRFLVLTPGQEQIGISRKVDDEEERSRLRELMNGIDPGDDLGVIVRTVSAGVTQATLKNDLSYLKRTWNEVRKHATGVTAPACVYKEPGLPERAVRDYLTDDVCEIWVDNAEIAARIKDTVAMLFPHKKDLVRVHNDARHSLWERFNLRRQLDQIYSREVLMPSGGRLVFDQTEALMAIDINSGKISCKGNFENMAFKTNMEAAETIARQLKLRDIGGQVVIDFIEMREHKHVLEVERTLRNAMKNDKARHDIARMSSFGLLELVRQRTGTSAISISMEPCPACGGTGLRRNLEWQSLQALRDIARILRSRATSPCRYEMTQELGLYVLNHKRDSLKELETQYGKNIEIVIRS